MAKIGKSCCLSCLFACCTLPCDRGSVRTRYQIPGSFCNDCVASCCCACCAIVQMSNEITTRTIYAPQPESVKMHDGVDELKVDLLPGAGSMGGPPPPVPSREEYQRRQSQNSPRVADFKSPEP